MTLPGRCARMPEGSPDSLLALGIDLGTSAVKVMVIDGAGTVAGEAQGEFATLSDLPGQAEQNPADWLAALAAAMRELDATISTRLGGEWRSRVGAIALTGQLPTLVCIGDRGPLAAAITWRDGRADPFASARMSAEQRMMMYSRTGMPIDGRYLAPMFGFHFADRIGAVRCILSAKDFLLFALTGVRVTDPSTAAGYGIYDLLKGAFSGELAAFWNIELTQLPRVLHANAVAGTLSKSGADTLQMPPGIPVITGAADSVCASYAMSGLDTRVASISLGSSAVVIASASTFALDSKARFLVTPHVQAGWYGREMDLLATGTGYRWLSELFGWADGELDRRAANSIAGAQGLFFPPYLAGGEQGALWNPNLRAGLFGLGLKHSSSDVARAYLEGVFFELRRCVGVIGEHDVVDCAMVSGNITRSDTSMQLLADILKRPVGRVLQKSPAAYGAALLARGAISGAPAPRAAGATAFYQPSDLAPRYDTLYDDYREMAERCARAFA
jgi:xylulokinase